MSKIINKICLCLLLVIGLGILFIGCNDNSIDQHIQKQILIAKESAENRDYAKSEKQLKFAISTIRKHYGAYYILEGYCYVKMVGILLHQGKVKDAESASRIADKILSDYGPLAEQGLLDCKIGKAAIYKYKGNYAQAESLYKEVINTCPLKNYNDSLFYYKSRNYLANTFKALERLDEAESVYVEVIDSYETNDIEDMYFMVQAYQGLSSIALKRNNMAETLRLLSMVSEKYPNILDENISLKITSGIHQSIHHYLTLKTDPDSLYSNTITDYLTYYGKSNINIYYICKELAVTYKFYGLDSLAKLYKTKAENIQKAIDEKREPDEEDLNLLVDWTEYCQESQ